MRKLVVVVLVLAVAVTAAQAAHQGGPGEVDPADLASAPTAHAVPTAQPAVRLVPPELPEQTRQGLEAAAKEVLAGRKLSEGRITVIRQMIRHYDPRVSTLAKGLTVETAARTDAVSNLKTWDLAMWRWNARQDEQIQALQRGVAGAVGSNTMNGDKLARLTGNGQSAMIVALVALVVSIILVIMALWEPACSFLTRRRSPTSTPVAS